MHSCIEVVRYLCRPERMHRRKVYTRSTLCHAEGESGSWAVGQLMRLALRLLVTTRVCYIMLVYLTDNAQAAA